MQAVLVPAGTGCEYWTLMSLLTSYQHQTIQYLVKNKDIFDFNVILRVISSIFYDLLHWQYQSKITVFTTPSQYVGKINYKFGTYTCRHAIQHLYGFTIKVNIRNENHRSTIMI